MGEGTREGPGVFRPRLHLSGEELASLSPEQVAYLKAAQTARTVAGILRERAEQEAWKFRSIMLRLRSQGVPIRLIARALGVHPSWVVEAARKHARWKERHGFVDPAQRP
ncbi:MAG TPA: hypothetical protein VNO79_00860 [Actinomycetota bacterium]|nr:hypothetical protein [Actinomycetota bacterium]